jgi:hypothetical protein
MEAKMVIEDPKALDRAVERGQDLPQAAEGHARLRLCVRGEQSEPVSATAKR